MGEGRCCHHTGCPDGERCIASIHPSEARRGAAGRNRDEMENRGLGHESRCELLPMKSVAANLIFGIILQHFLVKYHFPG